MLVIDDITIDGELVGEPHYVNEITRYPIESAGGLSPAQLIADHAQEQPVTLTVEGVVSDTPLGAVALIREIDGEVGGTAATDSAHARLVEIWRNKEPVTVRVWLGIFDNMVMESYTPRREGGSIRFTAEFSTATIIENERTVTVVAVPRAKKKERRRHVPTNLKDERGRSINKVGYNRDMTSIYEYDDGTRVPDDVADKAIKDTGAVKVRYINGQAVPDDKFDEAVREAGGVRVKYVDGRAVPIDEPQPWWQSDKVSGNSPVPGLGN